MNRFGDGLSPFVCRLGSRLVDIDDYDHRKNVGDFANAGGSQTFWTGSFIILSFKKWIDIIFHRLFDLIL